jgi:hypothetical protein
LTVDRSIFEQHFVEAAAAARDFARQFIEETLPDAMRFRVHLNMSHDRNAAPDFKFFPEDSSGARELAFETLEVEQVVDVLWRDGFFATLPAELVDDERYPTLLAAETSIGDYIENFYNVERLHSTLDYVSPIEFELKARVVMIAA